MKKTAALLSLLLLSAGASAAPYGAGWYDTSEYLLGKVAVAVVFPESNGALMPQTQTWSEARKAQVVAAVQNGMGWWSARYPGAALSFVFVTTTVATGYEPIDCNADPGSLPAVAACPGGEGDWIHDVMTRMGYAEADYTDQVYHYDNDVRSANGADWAFTVFVADSYGDADGEFPDGYFAYAYLGGPYAVTTYDNDSYGIGDFAPVIAHETGHIFYAQDEYAGSGCSPSSYSGYLNIANANCENGGSTNDPCVMRGGIEPYYSSSLSCPSCSGPAVCGYSRNMLGWRDGDSDGIPDIGDHPPTAVLSPFLPDPTSDTTPTYYGMAYSTTAYANSNPYDSQTSHYYYTSARNNISVGRIASAEYRVDGGGWLAASPRDGAFDQSIDSFTFTPAALPDGAHTFEARARDSFGAYSSNTPSDSLTVNTLNPTDIQYVNDGTGVDIDYVPSKTALSANWGESYHSSGIDRYEYAIGTSPGAADVAGWTSVATARAVTRTGLSLAENAVYYFAVRAHSVSGYYSGATVSDGQRVDTTSPTARVEITSPLPAASGPLTARLIVDEANGLSGAPSLRLRPGCGGLGAGMALSYAALSTWTASAFFETWFSTGTSCFAFSAVDSAGNTGAVITSGLSFTADPAVSGTSGGRAANSDGAAVTLPAGAYTGALYLTISTVPASRYAAADGAAGDSSAIVSEDLAREFSARAAAGTPVTSFLKPVTVTLSYPDSDGDGRVDGDFVPESRLWLYWLDEAAGRWKPLDGVRRDPAANTLSAETGHFSLYSVRVSAAAGQGLSGLKAYPNPCDLRRSAGLTIGGIPPDAAGTEIYIYNEAGELVRKLVPGDGVDGVNVGTWTGGAKGGGRAASGLYIYLVKTSNYGKGSGKFFLVR